MPEIGPHTREENLERLARETFDVCVIGGGITGAGIALDAASRGLSVVLVEREDFGAGTSSKSSKLIHGGLRYLANYEFGLTWESVRERDLLHRLAPHLVRPLRFLYPIFRKGRESVFASLGLTVYDLYDVGGGKRFRRHRRARPPAIRELAPLLDPGRLVSAYTYWDARTDDARLVFEIVRTAHSFGAVVANHCPVEGFERHGGRIAAALVTDVPTGRRLEVRARAFVNAAGVWADRVAALDAGAEVQRLRPAKGIHLMIEGSRLPLGAACIFPSAERDGRSLFAIPWGPVAMLGTTDTGYSGSVDRPSVDDDDVRYVLSAASAAFAIDLSPADCVGGFAGFRPLLDRAEGSKTVDLSRRHAVIRSPSGLVTITGGKLTTYRRMARDAVNEVCRDLGVRARSRTARIRLGLTGSARAAHAEARRLAGELRLDPETVTDLVAAHGDRAASVLALVAEDAALGAAIAPGVPTIAAELRWAVRHEMAVTLGDALERRTRLSLRDPTAGAGDPPAAAAALGWPLAALERQLEPYLEAVAAERGAAGRKNQTKVTK